MCVYMSRSMHNYMFRIVSACHVHVSHFWLSAGFAVKFVKLPIRKADLTIQDGRGYSPLHNATRPGTVQHSSTLNGLNGSTPVLSSAARPVHLPPPQLSRAGGGTWMWSSSCWPMELPQARCHWL